MPNARRPMTVADAGPPPVRRSVDIGNCALCISDVYGDVATRYARDRAIFSCSCTMP